MAINIYKPGQGYWTRTVSAIAGGVLLVGGVYWLWNQLSAIRALGDNVIWVQGASAVLLIGVFGTLLYRFLGGRPKSCDFLIATEGEMKKVNWPNRRGVARATGVVICCVVLMALLLYLADFAFFLFFRSIDVIQTS